MPPGRGGKSLVTTSVRRIVRTLAQRVLQPPTPLDDKGGQVRADHGLQRRIDVGRGRRGQGRQRHVDRAQRLLVLRGSEKRRKGPSELVGQLNVGRGRASRE